jgi:hypothetical protein
LEYVEIKSYKEDPPVKEELSSKEEELSSKEKEFYQENCE